MRKDRAEENNPVVPLMAKEDVNKIPKTANKTVFSKSYLSFKSSSLFFAMLTVVNLF